MNIDRKRNDRENCLLLILWVRYSLRATLMYLDSSLTGKKINPSNLMQHVS